MANKKKDLIEKKLVEEKVSPNDKAQEINDTPEIADKVDNFHESEEAEMEKKGTEEIFPFGPTYDQVSDWKSRYDGEIFMSDFNGEVLIWRPIRRKEYRDLQRVEGAADEYYLEESICRTCVLFPEDYAMHKITFGKAGVPTTLSQMIMERSGFLRPETFKL